MRINVEAHPNARAERVELIDGQVRVWVRARALEGEANAAIEQALARALGLPPRQVRLVRGATSRQKTVEVDIVDIDELRVRLRKRDSRRVD